MGDMLIAALAFSAIAIAAATLFLIRLRRSERAEFERQDAAYRRKYFAKPRTSDDPRVHASREVH